MSFNADNKSPTSKLQNSRPKEKKTKLHKQIRTNQKQLADQSENAYVKAPTCTV